jgi:dihydroneopterin aldolase
MDRIRIEGLEFHGFHGVSAAEQEIGHRYRVEALLELDLRPAAAADDVELTVDYGEAARTLTRVGTGPSVRLVETLAERMAAAVFAQFPRVQALELRVAKIHPPVALQFGAAVIEIRRTRADQ